MGEAVHTFTNLHFIYLLNDKNQKRTKLFFRLRDSLLALSQSETVVSSELTAIEMEVSDYERRRRLCHQQRE